jgi:hypothetical protein
MVYDPLLESSRCAAIPLGNSSGTTKRGKKDNDKMAQKSKV